MTCPTCGRGETAPRRVTKTLERGQTLVVVRDVPADVCQACGAPLFSGRTTEQLIELLTRAVRAGVNIEILRFGATEPASVAS